MPGPESSPPPESPAATPDPVSQFDNALTELESIVERMEEGEFPLEESIRLFERGVVLARQCRQSLERAELRVKRLMEADGGGDESRAPEDARP